MEETVEKHFSKDERLTLVKEQPLSSSCSHSLVTEFLTYSESKPGGISAAAEEPNARDTSETSVMMNRNATNGILGTEMKHKCSDVSPCNERRGKVEMQGARGYSAHNSGLSQSKKCRHQKVEKQSKKCLSVSVGHTGQACQGTTESFPVRRDVATSAAEHCPERAAAYLSVSNSASEREASPIAGQKDTTYVVTLTHTRTTNNSKERPSDGSNLAAMDSSVDNEEDIYRDAEEIEKENQAKGSLSFEEDSSGSNKLSVMPEIDIVEYCEKEWRGNTDVAKRMKKGYEAVSQRFISIRRVRGDNYCALRATLFQVLSQATDLPTWLQSTELTQLPEELIRKHSWLKHWKLQQQLNQDKNESLSGRLTEYLELLKAKWTDLNEIKSTEDKQALCEETFRNEDEYSLYEALKFLMLSKAVQLYNDNAEGKEVPVFSWLLFARNTSSTPCDFMRNHLNHVGHTGGLEQVEMFLLGYALQHTIKVYRLYKFETDEFITLYPNDQEDWPVVTLITEDDRHYNVPVRLCEETSV